MYPYDSTEEFYETYINSLEQQIEDKRFFLLQARNAIESLQNGGNGEHLITPEQWQDFLKKPMFFPERTDPIGLSLASASFITRQKTSEEWLEHTEKELGHMQTMIRDQEQINQNMLVLIELLEQKSDRAFANALMSESLLQRNRRLLRELEEFVENYLALDMANAENSNETVYRDTMEILSRLIRYDTHLKTTDFPQSTKGLFRLLLRSNLIALEDEESARYVRLLDFPAPAPTV